MEIKIVDRPLWKGVAALSFVFAVIQFWGAHSYYSSAYFLSGISFILLGLGFLMRKNLTYLTLGNNSLTIHLRGFLSKKKINNHEIEEAEFLEKAVILQLEDERKYKLKKDWISHEDLVEFKKELKAHSVIIR
ncbi:EbsA family protein [Aquisalibacillus elongatus]|uniref:PH (Pleckstrin Homology) domain-containing protein n=1 Tax=Aquisalibacillus elongatus TaxID=485577 RepID=A0A3N5BJR7_9BACI|nr:EbsA family protein [Aquisalibacillus elongatus]RPF55500.1 hypothetical protein EDC24_0378 [Aquisalibacillus elongatus]